MSRCHVGQEEVDRMHQCWIAKDKVKIWHVRHKKSQKKDDCDKNKDSEMKQKVDSARNNAYQKQRFAKL